MTTSPLCSAGRTCCGPDSNSGLQAWAPMGLVPLSISSLGLKVALSCCYSHFFFLNILRSPPQFFHHVCNQFPALLIQVPLPKVLPVFLIGP